MKNLINQEVQNEVFKEQFESFKKNKFHLKITLLINVILIPTIIAMNPWLGIIISVFFIHNLRNRWVGYRFERAMLFLAGDYASEELTSKHYESISEFW